MTNKKTKNVTSKNVKIKKKSVGSKSNTVKKNAIKGNKTQNSKVSFSKSNIKESKVLLDEIEKRNSLKDNNVIKKYKFNKNKCIRFVLLVLLSCVFLYSVTSLVLNQIDYYRNRRDSQRLIDEVVLPNDSVDNIGEVNENENEELPEDRPVINPLSVRIDFNKLLSTNGDVKAWMMFNSMYVNNPVVQSSDNEYYLNHNFYGKNSEIGTIFMDYRNNSFDDRNVVLFGHSTIDKSMFGSLSDVFKSGFFDRENADIIYFYDVNNNLIKYQIFSYYTIESEEYYIQTRFSSDDKFQEWINTVKSRSFGNRGIEVTSSDKILTLSTCAGSRGTSKRRVVHAKRIQ